MSTQKYLCLHRSAPPTTPREPPSPATMQEMYAAFSAWQDRFKHNIVDMGAQLKGGGKVLSATGVTDGPFVETKEIIGGYMVLAADSYEHALEIARALPGMLSPGSSVEVRELASP